MALGADVAVMYFNWVQLQKAADAAAIAGASQLTGQPDPTGTIPGNGKAYAAGYACLNAINDPNAASDAGVSGAQATLVTTTCPPRSQMQVTLIASLLSPLTLTTPPSQ